MITIFGSSTSYISFPEYGKSYVHLLRENDFITQSFCQNGYTIWHANYILPKMLTERHSSNVVILHVGACEAMTMALSNFLAITTHWLNFGEVDHYFMTYFAPKMQQAAADLHEGKSTFYSYLTADEFYILYKKVLKHLEQYTVLAIGMSQPSNDVGDIRREQALNFDDVILRACAESPWAMYIDVWNLCEGEVVDSSHLTIHGHKLLFDEIVKRV